MTHHHEIKSDLSLEEKLAKLLDHWLKHNEDHSETYSDWAKKAKEAGLERAASLIENAADMTLEINKQFMAAIDSLKPDE